MTDPFDLIRMVQAARRQHDQTARPSQAEPGYWVEAHRLAEGLPPTPRAGHWVVHTTVEQIDDLWGTLKAATERGELGYKARASSAPRSRGAAPNQRVILICTFDADDQADVNRVRDALVRLVGGAAGLVYEAHQPPTSPAQ